MKSTTMKKVTKAIFALTVFALAGFAQDTKQDSEKQKPKATYQIGSAKVVVWENKKADGTTWKNFQVEKVYKKGDEWKTTNSFNETELLELKTAIDKAISEEAVKVKTTTE
jgi:hypothetical protein